MQNLETKRPEGLRQGHETNRWYDDLREIMASEAFFTIPNCEVLLDRIASGRGGRS